MSTDKYTPGFWVKYSGINNENGWYFGIVGGPDFESKVAIVWNSDDADLIVRLHNEKVKADASPTNNRWFVFSEGYGFVEFDNEEKARSFMLSNGVTYWNADQLKAFISEAQDALNNPGKNTLDNLSK